MMKERIKKLEKKHKSKKSDEEIILELAKRWKFATSKRDWQKADSIRSKAKKVFDAHPAWLERTSGLRLPKVLFMEWYFFVNWLDKKIQKNYKSAVLKGFHPGVSMIKKRVSKPT